MEKRSRNTLILLLIINTWHFKARFFPVVYGCGGRYSNCNAWHFKPRFSPVVCGYGVRRVVESQVWRRDVIASFWLRHSPCGSWL